MKTKLSIFFHLLLTFHTFFITVKLQETSAEHQKETLLVLEAANSYANHLEAAISLIFPSMDRLGDSYKPVEEALSVVNDPQVQEYITKTQENYVPYYSNIMNMVNDVRSNVLMGLSVYKDDFQTVGDYLDEGFTLIKEIFKANGCTEDSLRSYIFEVNRNLSMVVQELAFTQHFYNTIIDIIPQTLYYSFPQAIQQALYRSEDQLEAVKRVEFRQMLSDQQTYKDAVENAKWIVNGFTRHGYTSTRKRLEEMIDKAVVGASKSKCRKAKKMTPTPKHDSSVKQ